MESPSWETQYIHNPNPGAPFPFPLFPFFLSSSNLNLYIMLPLLPFPLPSSSFKFHIHYQNSHLTLNYFTKSLGEIKGRTQYGGFAILGFRPQTHHHWYSFFSFSFLFVLNFTKPHFIFKIVFNYH